jgi:hypothetical protein
MLRKVLSTALLASRLAQSLILAARHPHAIPTEQVTFGMTHPDLRSINFRINPISHFFILHF